MAFEGNMGEGDILIQVGVDTSPFEKAIEEVGDQFQATFSKAETAAKKLNDAYTNTAKAAKQLGMSIEEATDPANFDKVLVALNQWQTKQSQIINQAQELKSIYASMQTGTRTNQSQLDDVNNSRLMSRRLGLTSSQVPSDAAAIKSIERLKAEQAGAIKQAQELKAIYASMQANTKPMAVENAELENAAVLAKRLGMTLTEALNPINADKMVAAMGQLQAEQAGAIKQASELKAIYAEMQSGTQPLTGLAGRDLNDVERTLAGIQRKYGGAQYSLAQRRDAEGYLKQLGTSGVTADMMSKEQIDRMNQATKILGTQMTQQQKQVELFSRHLVQWGAYLAVITAAYTILSQIESTFKAAVHDAAEFQSQSVNFLQMQKIGLSGGLGYQPAGTGELMADSIALAEKYGDNINDVAEAMQLWYKQTGSLNNALFMTNEALKVQLATGLDLEDFYRGFTAIAFQAQGVKLTPESKTSFNLGQAPQLANMMYAASMYGGAGMGIQHESSADGINKTANAFGILQKASEQDVSALGRLGISMSEIIALNQGLITSMGNFGENADQAAERLARLVGGFAELSKVSTATALKKNLGLGNDYFDQFQKTMNSGQGDFLEKFAKFYTQLSPTAQNVLATTIANQRGFETSANIVKVILGNLQNIEKVEKDKNALDDAANQMQGTYNTQLDKTKAAWQAITLVLGTTLLPLLTNIMKQTADWLGVLFGGIGRLQDIGGKMTFTVDPYTFLKNPMSLGVTQNPEFQTWKQRVMDSAMKNSRNVPAGAFRAIQDSTGENQLISTLYAVPYGKNSTLGDLIIPGSSNSMAAMQGRLYGSGKKIDQLSQHYFDLAQMQRVQSILGGDSGAGNVADPSGGKSGISAAAAAARAALSLQAAMYKEQNAEIQKNLNLLDKDISINEKIASQKGMTKDVMDALNKEYTQENNLLQQQLNHTTNADKGVQGQINALKTKVAGEKSGPQKTADMSELARLLDFQSTLIEKEGTLQGKIDENAYKQSNLAYQNVQYNINQLVEKNKVPLAIANDKFSSTSDIQQKAAALNTIIGLERSETDEYDKQLKDLMAQPHTQTDVNNLLMERIGIQQDINTKNKELKDIIDSVAKSISDTETAYKDQAESLLESTVTNKAEKDALQEQVELRKANLAYEQQMYELRKENVPEKMLNDLTNDYNAWVDISDQVYKYKENLDALDNSVGFQALQKSLDTALQLSTTQIQIGVQGASGVDYLTTSLPDELMGITSQQELLQTYQNQVSALTNEKDILDYIYNAQLTHTTEQKEAYTMENLQLQDQIKNLQQIEQLKQNQLNHPSFLQSFTKSIFGDITSGFEKQLTSGFTNLFTGGQSNGQGLQNAMSAFTTNSPDSLVPDLTDALNVFSNQGSNSLVPDYISAENAHTQALNNYVQAMGTGGAGGAPALNGYSNLSADMNYNVNTTVSGVGFGSDASGGMTGYAASIANAAGVAGALGIAAGTNALFTNQPQSSVQSSVTQGNSTITNSSTGQTFDAGSAVGVGMSPQQFDAMPSIPSTQFGFGQIGTPGGAFGPGSTLGQNIGTGVGIIGAGMSLYGSLTGGGGFQNALTGAMAGAELGSLGGPLGTAIGAGVGFFGGLLGIGNHDVPANMPDKYDTTRFTLYVGELQGAAGTAYGPPFNPANDPVIQALGGESILQYIQKWISQNINSSDPAKQKLASQLKPLYGTTGGGLAFGHDIADESVKGGSLSGTYVTIYQKAMQDLQQIMALTGLTNQPDQLVSLNQFGTSGGGFTYSWDIPGYNAPSTPPGSTTQGGTAGAPPGGNGSAPPLPPPGTGPGSPGSGGSGGTSSAISMAPRSSAAYGYSVPSVSISPPPINLSHEISIPLDGRVLARTTQAYTMRATAQGYSRISI